ncbi:MAG: DUF4292 domain-containing protein [Flavobacteriaceae bacterium]|nr:DUF4292 domain-containing protein [Flavobacteriaceae bacterium]
MKKSIPATGEVEDQSINSFASAYQAELPEFDYVQIRSKLSTNIGGKSVNPTLRLYIEKDKLMWANASILGITGARALINHEGVKAYETLDKTYIDSDFSFFNEKLKMNFIDYDRLQQLLLGQLFLIEPWSSYSLQTTSDNQYALEYKLNKELENNFQEGKYIHTFYLDSNYRLLQVSILDKSSATSISVNYDNWQQLNGNNFPGKVTILIKGKETDTIELEYNNFDFSQMTPPFRIPDGYTLRALD